MVVEPARDHWPGGGAAALDRRTPTACPIYPECAPAGRPSGPGRRPGGRHERGRPPAHPAAPPSRTARSPPPGLSPRAGYLLVPSLPTTATTHAHGGRQRCRRGRRPPLVAACSLTPRRPAARPGPGNGVPAQPLSARTGKNPPLPAGRAGEPLRSLRRRPLRRPATRPKLDSAARTGADLRRCCPVTSRLGGPPPASGYLLRRFACRTASDPPPGRQDPGTAPLTPSPPSTATTHTPAARQRYRKGRRPGSSRWPDLVRPRTRPEYGEAGIRTAPAPDTPLSAAGGVTPLGPRVP